MNSPPDDDDAEVDDVAENGMTQSEYEASRTGLEAAWDEYKENVSISGSCDEDDLGPPENIPDCDR